VHQVHQQRCSTLGWATLLHERLPTLQPDPISDPASDFSDLASQTQLISKSSRQQPPMVLLHAHILALE
jgi:hypothetical protein